MKKLNHIIIVVIMGALCSSLFIACSSKGCTHDYKVIDGVAVTCTEDGWTTYECAKCGDTYTQEHKAKGHVPGAEATEDSVQVCTVCGVVLDDEKNDHTSVKKSIRALSINYVDATNSAEYCESRIDTQLHSRYALPENTYYRDKNGINPLSFKASVPVQEFYTHDIFSVYDLSTQDGKTFSTSSGFKVRFNIDKVNLDLSKLYAYNELSLEYDNPQDLRIVRMYPAPAYFNKIYEVVDFSSSYIEVAKQTGSTYTSVAKDSLANIEAKNSTLSDIEFSDNGKLFMERGMYRILFKYSMAWVTNPTMVYDIAGKSCYPYGFINDQYDYFYINIGDEQANILMPDSNVADGANLSDDMFYQIRANSINKERLFLPAESTIEFGEKLSFSIDTILDYADDSFSFKGDKLKSFVMRVYRYDANQDIAGEDPYKIYETIDLAKKLTSRDSFEVKLNKDSLLRDYSCKIVIQSVFSKSGSFETYTLTQVYKVVPTWEQ